MNPALNLNPEALAEQAQRQQQEQAQKAEEDARRELILDQIMDPDAKERLNRLALVKSEQARKMGDSLIKAATTGQLREKVNDDALKRMLESGVDASGASLNAKLKISIQRRKFDSDDSDDNDDDLL